MSQGRPATTSVAHIQRNRFVLAGGTGGAASAPTSANRKTAFRSGTPPLLAQQQTAAATMSRERSPVDKSPSPSGGGSSFPLELARMSSNDLMPIVRRSTPSPSPGRHNFNDHHSCDAQHHQPLLQQQQAGGSGLKDYICTTTSSPSDSQKHSGPLDTHHIQLYLKKLDNKTDLNVGSSSGSGGGGGEKKKASMSTRRQNTDKGTAQPVTTKSRQYNFKGASKSNFILSMSSSVDSAKEDKILGNMERKAGANTTTVKIVPKPPPPAPPASIKIPDLKVRAHSEERNLSPSVGDEHAQLLNLSPHFNSSVLPTSPASSNASSNSYQHNLIGGNLSEGLVWHSVTDLSISASDAHPPRPQSQCDNPFGGGGVGGKSEAAVPKKRSSYLGELVWQVDEIVLCGGIEAVQNQNLLCRLNIEYIVDLSGQDDDPSIKTRTQTPCLCSKRTAHSRMTMAIKVPDESDLSLRPMIHHESTRQPFNNEQLLKEREEIISSFEVLIDLIRKARIGHKKVLIHSMKGRNRAPAFVAAYLMHCNRCTRVQAIAKISKMMSKMRPGLCIADGLQRALMRWQSRLGK